jgi:hypothetical protein
VGLITLRSSHTGQYLCAENGGGSAVLANRAVAREWEWFRRIDHGAMKVSLQSVSGWFLCAEGGGGREVTMNRRAASDWETFTQVVHADGRASFRAHNGQWVCVEQGGIVVANRDVCDEWEKFTASDVAKDQATLDTKQPPFRNPYGMDLPVRCRQCGELVQQAPCPSCGATAL